MIAVADLLRQVPLFRTLESAEIAFLAERCQLLTFEPDSIFITEDEYGDCMYVIADGTVEIIKALGTQEESLLATYGLGELVGEMGLLNPNQPRSASARTVGPVSLLTITRDDIEQLLPRFPSVSMDFLGILSERLYSAAGVVIRDLTIKNKELNHAYAELKAAQERLIQQEVVEQELRHAQRIQQQMLPRTLPRFPNVDIGATMIAARMVGGDFYDVLPIDDHTVALVVGDVSGKGIPAALYMALVCSLLRATVRTVSNPVEALEQINAHLCERDMDSMFVTVVYGVLDLRTRTLTYAVAGHGWPLMWRANGELVALEPPRSRPLGLLETTLLNSGTQILEPHSTILLYSDGVTEAMNAEGEMFGRKRLLDIVDSNSSASATALCERIVAAVTAHQGDAPQFDDITLLALRLT